MCAYVHIFNQKLITFSGLYAPELTNGKVTSLNLVSRAADYFRLDTKLECIEGIKHHYSARVFIPPNELAPSIFPKKNRSCFDSETHISFVCGYFELCLGSFLFLDNCNCE